MPAVPVVLLAPGDDPPNATLSVYDPGKSENTLTVVEISKPRIDGSDLVYTYRLFEGDLPAKGGATSLFIDWIGVGGGVGRGFHGVGVGRRGPGIHELRHASSSAVCVEIHRVVALA